MENKRTASLVRQIEGRCHHYTGTQNESCKAGVNYMELAGPLEGIGLRLPCTPPHVFEKRREECGYKMAVCPKLQRITHEEAEKEAAEIIERSDRNMAIIEAAHKEAKSKGFRKGNGGRGVMPCPSNCGGTLTYSVASHNGHMHGQCSTEGCVSWME